MSGAFEKLFEDFYELSELDFIESVKRYHSTGGEIFKVSNKHGCALLHLAAENDCLELIDWLVFNGVNLESKNTQEWTALMLAVDSDIDNSIQNNTDVGLVMASHLIELGADINAELPNGKSIYAIAESYGSKTHSRLIEVIKKSASG